MKGTNTLFGNNLFLFLRWYFFKKMWKKIIEPPQNKVDIFRSDGDRGLSNEPLELRMAKFVLRWWRFILNYFL
jgi:hypothetical protein